MKKSILVLFVFVLINSLNTKAQDSYLGFSLGTGIPQSVFAEDMDLLTHGYAIPGFTVGFEGFYYPISIVGVGGVLNFSSLYASRDKYLDDFLEYAYSQTQIPIFAYPVASEDVEFESGFWNYINLMVGPELAVPFWRFQAGVRALGGLNVSFYPKRDIKFSDGADELSSMAKGPSAALAYSLGANLLYKARSGTGLRPSVDYLYSEASYDFTMETVIAGDDNSFTTSESIDIETLSVSIGFFYTF